MSEPARFEPIGNEIPVRLASPDRFSSHETGATSDEIRSNISDDLSAFLQRDEDLRISVFESIRSLENSLENADINAFLESGLNDQSQTNPVIKVESSFDTIEEYRSLKSQVRDIVRRSEQGDAIIYTQIRQI